MQDYKSLSNEELNFCLATKDSMFFSALDCILKTTNFGELQILYRLVDDIDKIFVQRHNCKIIYDLSSLSCYYQTQTHEYVGCRIGYKK